MKTGVYIDGYNFYYGCLKGTPYKWLDLVRLFSNYILPASAPPGTVLHQSGIKLYTADIVHKAAKSTDSVKDQQAYHRALQAASDQLTIIKGYYSVKTTTAYCVDKTKPKQEPKHCNRVSVWKLEEKQSDVNLAIESLYDAMTIPDLEQVVIVTNDTDLVPALKKIKALGHIKIGLVIPIKKGIRAPNTSLTQYADWVRNHIFEEELRMAQLPRVVSTSGRKNAVKPESWFGQPKIVEQIMQTLLVVHHGKRNKCWHWLETQKPQVPNLPVLSDLPINLLDNEQSATDVLQHARAYANFKGCLG